MFHLNLYNRDICISHEGKSVITVIKGRLITRTYSYRPNLYSITKHQPHLINTYLMKSDCVYAGLYFVVPQLRDENFTLSNGKCVLQLTK